MTRVYGNIQEVYIQNQGWVVYNAQPLNTVEMLTVQYDDYNEDGANSEGIEEFSLDRWITSQQIDLTNNNPFAVLGDTPPIKTKEINTITTTKKQRINPFDTAYEPTTKAQKTAWKYFTDKGYNVKCIKMQFVGRYKNRYSSWLAWDVEGKIINESYNVK